MAPAPRKKERREPITATTPTGRLINASLFEKDVYVDERTGKEGTPQYKLEMTFDPNDVQGDDKNPNYFEDRIFDAIEAEWGKGAIDDFINGKIKCFVEGDKLAKKREQKGKEGSAYKGKLVLRATTVYNKDGADGPGGIQVFGPDVSPIDFANQGEIYLGCYVQANVTIHCYDDNNGDPAIKFYLNAVQKVKEGERLVPKKDMAGAFKPVGRTEGAASGRRSRAG